MVEENPIAKNSEDDMSAYNIILQRHINEDRTIIERISVFLLSSSILFLGFVVLDPSSWLLRIIVPSLGILSCSLVICVNRGSWRALNFWDDCERKIEDNGPSFAYMREQEMRPHSDMESFWFKRRAEGWLLRITRSRIMFCLYFPLLFFILWVCSLIWVLI